MALRYEVPTSLPWRFRVVGSCMRKKKRSRASKLVFAGSNWHRGVVGIVASRLVDRFHRPALVLGIDPGSGLAQGSGRSIPGFDLAAALNQCGDLLIRHGGHAMAAGLSLEPGCLDAFRERFNTVASQKLSPEALQPSLRLDGEVSLGDVDLGCLEVLNQLRPMGQGNSAVLAFLRQDLLDPIRILHRLPIMSHVTGLATRFAPALLPQ